MVLILRQVAPWLPMLWMYRLMPRLASCYLDALRSERLRSFLRHRCSNSHSSAEAAIPSDYSNRYGWCSECCLSWLQKRNLPWNSTGYVCLIHLASQKCTVMNAVSYLRPVSSMLWSSLQMDWVDLLLNVEKVYFALLSMVPQSWWPFSGVFR